MTALHLAKGLHYEKEGRDQFRNPTSTELIRGAKAIEKYIKS